MNPSSRERAGESVKPSLTVRQKLTHELKALTVAGLYFATWIGTLLLLKELVLAEYSIAFHHLSLALIGALILSKVVLFNGGGRATSDASPDLIDAQKHAQTEQIGVWRKQP